MPRPLLIATLIACTAQAATAQTCYTRTYSDAHLAKKPNQTVRSISVLELVGNEPPLADVTVVFRDGPARWTTGVFCEAGGLPYDPGAPKWCGVECDGGTFTLTPAGDGAVLLTTPGFRVGLGCADPDDAPTRRVTDLDVSKTVYRLNRAAPSAC